MRAIQDRLPTGALGVSVYDYLSGGAWSFNGDQWFHAASIMKVAVLVALFDAVEQGRFTLANRLHVRNRFLSLADGMPFRVDLARDADADVHGSIGRTMRLNELARHMIITSSNLATNLLLDLIGIQATRETLERMEIEGVDIRRGVEDDRAFTLGLNNQVTPNGAVALMRAIVARSFTPESSMTMLNILLNQQFNGTIAPGLPEKVRSVARVAHKTGDISTASHDAGVVFLPGRPPYLVAVMVESSGDSRERIEAGTAASTAVYECVAAAGEAMSR